MVCPVRLPKRGDSGGLLLPIYPVSLFYFYFNYMREKDEGRPIDDCPVALFTLLARSLKVPWPSMDSSEKEGIAASSNLMPSSIEVTPSFRVSGKEKNEINFFFKRRTS